MTTFKKLPGLYYFLLHPINKLIYIRHTTCIYQCSIKWSIKINLATILIKVATIQAATGTQNINYSSKQEVDTQ